MLETWQARRSQGIEKLGRNIAATPYDVVFNRIDFGTRIGCVKKH